MSTDRATVVGPVPDRAVEQKPTRGEGVREHGARVLDADANQANREPAVVINTPPATLDEWVAYRDEGEEVTVADDNPAYDESDNVVVVAYEHELDEVRPDYQGRQPIELDEFDSRYYAYPPRRLVRVGHATDESTDEAVDGDGDEDGTDDTDQYPELSTLAERVGGEVLVEDGEPEVLVERLGAIHHISADGSVDGGPMQKQLTEAAADVLGGGDE